MYEDQELLKVVQKQMQGAASELFSNQRLCEEQVKWDDFLQQWMQHARDLAGPDDDISHCFRVFMVCLLKGCVAPWCTPG